LSCSAGLDECDERRALDNVRADASSAEDFLRYCTARAAFSFKSAPEYTESWWSYQELYAYGKRKSYEAWLIKTLRKKFGSPVTTMFFIGNYSANYRPSMRGAVPAFVVGFARLLRRYARVQF
jgi:hypothetical protein